MAADANARLWSSLTEGDVGGAVQAIQDGADVNFAGSGGGRPLHSAALRNGCHLVRILVDNGALCNVFDSEGYTPLMVASLNGCTKGVEELLKCGADPTSHRPEKVGGETALHMATNTDESEVLRLLLLAGADPNARARGANAKTPLHFVAEFGREGLADLLVNHPRCSADLRDDRGLTPAHLAKESNPRLSLYLDLCSGAKSYLDKLLLAAVRRSDVAEAREALDMGADVGVRGSEDAGTVLHLGSSGPVLQMLLTKGAPVDATTRQGLTPLMAAAQKGATDDLMHLLAHRANPNMASSDGTTALHLAIQSKDSSAVTALLEAGVDVNAAMADGSTPLHLAAALGAMSIVRLLLDDWMCSFYMTDAKGRSPVQVAREAGHQDLASFIEQVVDSYDDIDDEGAEARDLLRQEDFRVVIGQPVPPSPGVYRNLSEPYRGRVLIINYREFWEEEGATRYGSERDVNNLKNVFRKMGYQVEDYQDLGQSETIKVLSDFRSNENLANVDSMFVCMLSHGNDRDTFITSDSKKMHVSQVRNMFKDQRCPHLKGKPKVFLFNFCRDADDLNDRYEEPPDVDEAPRDMLTLYATTEGFKALRLGHRGTFFVMSLCQTLATRAHNTDMFSMTQRLDQLMTARHHATTPEAQSFAFKKFFLNPFTPSDA
ncbi:ankyrin-2-like isoform X2 [Penaeus japonicus]|uniref:ankyrin-2-like isoform X2 n=1 Tax=Penaeus japonicus TaxID=27405 RepID=UPI001C70C768|nr:ankyrin-2-like isoform X2 [Penaeus japonicus]XP_042889476.1 ankyrin-2-like isoform X2 [Penaeus japonicus]